MSISVDPLVTWLLAQRNVQVIIPVVQTIDQFKFYTTYVTFSAGEEIKVLSLRDIGLIGEINVSPMILPLTPDIDSNFHEEILLLDKIDFIQTSDRKYLEMKGNDISTRFLSLSIFSSDKEIYLGASDNYAEMIQVSIFDRTQKIL